MALTHILPDPTNLINAAGQASPSGVAGVGFSGIKNASIEPLIKTRTNSIRSEKSRSYHHKWQVNIAYNPLTCAEFHLIYAFINEHHTSLIPFYISIPPYDTQTLTGITIEGNTDRETTLIEVAGTGVRPGYLFNIAGSTKAHKVSRVETSTDYIGLPPTSGERIHIVPGLLEYTLDNTVLFFQGPLIKVRLMTNKVSYSINKSGLFQLSLALEEVL